MDYLPCKKCPDCGKYHSFVVNTCFCGADLSSLISVPMNKKSVAIDECGDLDFEGQVYAVKCDFCATEHYVADKEKGVQYCLNARCGKRGISRKTPILWTFGDQKDACEPKDKPDSEPKVDVNIPVAETPKQVDTQNTDNSKKLSKEASEWFISMANVKERVDTHSASVNTTSVASDNSADDDMSGWYVNSDGPDAIELTLSTDPSVSFKVEVMEGREYMIGREANQKEALNDDNRVGRKHCWLVFEDGGWYVIDNNSNNGTFVDGNDIGYGGKAPLRNGSVVTLGHWSDSPSFIVTL